MDAQGMFDVIYNVSGTISIIGLIVIVISFIIAKIKNKKK